MWSVNAHTISSNQEMEAYDLIRDQLTRFYIVYITHGLPKTHPYIKLMVQIFSEVTDKLIQWVVP